MKKIRVCHVVSGLRAGGVESMIYNYCSKLNSDKFEWFMLYQHEPARKNLQEFESINFKLCQIPSKIIHPLKNYMETYKFLKKNQIDVVHCHMTLMNWIPLLAAKKLKIQKRICHSHNADVRKKNLLKKIIEKILKKMCIILSTDLVACGDDAGKYLYGNNKYLILNNALDLEKFKFNEEYRIKNRKKYGVSDDEILIGHIGRFTNQKNHEFIVEFFSEIYKKNKKFKLILIGDGENQNTIKNKIKDYKLEDVVIFTGILDNCNELLSSFDIFILPSLWEGLPVVSIEAQISNLKCIFSDKIDQKSKIIDTTMFLNIKYSDLWKNEILEYVKKGKNVLNNRKNINAKFYENGWNISNEKHKLEELYIL